MHWERNGDSIHSQTAFRFDWGHQHEPNAYETVLQKYAANAQVTEMPFVILWNLPPQLSGQLDIADLPVIGASPDGLITIDPSNTSQSVAVLEARVPFSHYKKQWHYIETSTASSKAEPSHFAQVQFEMLVTGKTSAYLVYWSCKCTHIFEIHVDYGWLQLALALLCKLQKLFLCQQEVPPPAFFETGDAQELRQCTKKALSAVNSKWSGNKVKAESVLNTTVANPFL